MALIVLMEDDAGTRTLIASVLKKDGHEVLDAEDGAKGLMLVETRHPDLVISDVQMPEMNGFQMLAALRQNPEIAATPVILLTSLQERAHMRIGMTTGADDYITKPFRPAELREATAAQLNKRTMHATLQSMAVDKAVQAALEEQRHQLAKLYEQRLATELSERWPTGSTEGDQKFPSATVLFVDIPSYAGVAERLQPAELAELVRKFYGSANDTAHLFGAAHMQFIGEGVLAIFVDATDTQTVNHGLRAMRAALGLVEAGRAIQTWLAGTYPGRDLPRFQANVALHAGAVTLTRLHDPLHAPGALQLLPVGDAVSATIALQRQARLLGWPIVASVAALRSVTGAVEIGRRALVDLPGRSGPMDVAEITGLAH